MASAACAPLFYPVMPPGETTIVGQIDVVVAGSDVLGGRYYVGPVNGTPVTIRNKIGTAVRNWASEFCPATAGGVGVTIPTNEVLTGDFAKA